MGMSHYWDQVLKPIVDTIRPGNIVQIGCGGGKTTESLLACREENPPRVFAIDKWLDFDPKEFEDRFDSRFVLHRSLALNALPQVEEMDLVIVDGDPNWYTVYNQLLQIEKTAKKNDRPFPCVVIHNISWPYARRDGYRDPGVIPDAYRQPNKKLGVAPDNPELIERGLYSGRYHAVYENEQRNGVLTAVENFVQESQFALDWVPVPFRSGVGLLFSEDLPGANSDFAAVVKDLILAPPVMTMLESAEKNRSALALRIDERQAAVERLERDRAKLQENIKKLKEKMESQKKAHMATSQATKRELEEVKATQADELAAIQVKCQETEAEVRSLNLRIQDLSEQLEEKIINLTSLQADLEIAEKGAETAKGLEQQLSEARSELIRLRKDDERKSKAVRQLISWMNGMTGGMERHFKSWSWRVGAGVVGIARRLMLKKEVPLQSLQVFKIGKEFKTWKSRNGSRWT